MGILQQFFILVTILSSSRSEDSTEKTQGKSLGTLVNHAACREDLLALSHGCGLSKQEMENDFAALNCAQNVSPDKFESISETCEQVLWRFKMNLTTSSLFIDQINKACSRDAEKLNLCKNSYPGPENSGHFMSCLIDEKMNGGFKPACQDFLTQVETIIFSDYRLIADFADKCRNDIEGNNCGHVRRQIHSDSNVIFYHHSQGLVLECLTKHVDQVEPQCKEEILHIAELQSDDYHLDRTLYFACKADRQKLCPVVKSGNGQIYQCLLTHKEDDAMSEACREQLRRRQKLVSENYKVSRGLVKACKEEIKANKCKKQTSNDVKTVRLAEILLCLEEVMRNEDAVIGGPCQAEMKSHRQMLMEDYSISPELMAKCGSDIANNCQKETQKKGPGEVIHCLLRTAMERKIEDTQCEDELKVLLKEVDVASDWRVDPALKKDCQDVVAAVCSPTNVGPESVLSCLMHQVATQSRQMTKDCKERLLEIQFFMARDFSLDPKLYKQCRRDAQDLCQADEHWYTTPNQGQHQFIFACLVRNLYETEEEDNVDKNEEPTLSDQCADEVERVLEQRAISVKLHPEIDDSCRTELAVHCSSVTGTDGEELKCLQDNFEALNQDCLNAIRTYTEIEAKNVILNPVIAANCYRIIDEHCQDEVSHKDEGLVIQCLVKFRDEHKEAMDDKCEAAVEHWQILSLKDWRFSYKFKEACKKDIQAHCVAIVPKTKSDVIECLSEIARNDVIFDKPEKTLSPSCQAQLKFQLLQKHSSIKLNPKILNRCKQAIQTSCPIGRGNVLECLKSLDHQRMSAKCRSAVFEEQQEEVLISGVDHELLIGCKHEIKRHCPQQNEVNGLLNCLKEVKEDSNFDRSCKLIVDRRVIQYTKDYRLRPRLQKACEHDLKNWCANVLLTQGDKDTTKDFLEGLVIECLQTKYIEDGNLLSQQCRRELEMTVRDEAMDYRANPIILMRCPKTIAACETALAEDQLDMQTSEYGSKVEDCLRLKFKKGDIPDGDMCSQAIAKLIEETNIDIQADPLLHRACALDLSKFCRDVPHGGGQQLKCLSNVIRDNKLGLEPKCDSLLRTRLEMFDLALKVVPINGVQDIWYHVSNSPHKNYFLLLVFCFFSAIFIFGILCGRVTKKLRRDLKDK